MSENKKQQDKKTEKKTKLNIKIDGLDIDKREYQEIVLSNSNYPSARGYQSW